MRQAAHGTAVAVRVPAPTACGLAVVVIRSYLASHTGLGSIKEKGKVEYGAGSCGRWNEQEDARMKGQDADNGSEHVRACGRRIQPKANWQ
jgi:hypothetical protein